MRLRIKFTRKGLRVGRTVFLSSRGGTPPPPILDASRLSTMGYSVFGLAKYSFDRGYA